MKSLIGDLEQTVSFGLISAMVLILLTITFIAWLTQVLVDGLKKLFLRRLSQAEKIIDQENKQGALHFLIKHNIITQRGRVAKISFSTGLKSFPPQILGSLAGLAMTNRSIGWSAESVHDLKKLPEKTIALVIDGMTMVCPKTAKCIDEQCHDYLYAEAAAKGISPR